MAAMERASTQKEYRRLELIELLYRGYEPVDARKILRISVATYYRWINLFNEQGVSGLTPKPKSGRTSKISEELGAEIVELMKTPSTYGETHWTAIKLHGHLKKEHEIDFSYKTLLRDLRKRGLKRIVPRRHPLGQDAEQREKFITTLNELYSDPDNTIFFLDECGFEGDPKPRKEWILPGQKASTHYLGDHIRTNVIGAVDPKIGEFLSFIVPFVDKDVFQLFVDHLAKQKEDIKNLFVILDNASWHTSPSICWHHITPIFLPAYSPDLNPIERLWNDIKNNRLGNWVARTFEALDDKVSEILKSLLQEPEAIKATCLPKLVL